MSRRPGRPDKLVVSAAGVVVVFVLCVAYIVSGVLDTPLTSPAREVRVDLPSTGGLYEGSAVTYRGVHVGKVTRIDFTATGVRAIASLTSSTQIPRDTRAVVRSLSPVGEQYLDFQPRVDHGPWLQNGSTVRATRTDVPETLASTVIAVNKLLGQVDAGKLRTVLRESSRALAGTSDDLNRLTDQGRLLVRDLNRHWPQAERVLANGGTLLDIGADNAARIRRSARDFRAFARFLRAYRPELDRALLQAPAQLEQLHAIVREADATLPPFLSVGTGFMELVAAYDPHLRALLDHFAPGLGVLAEAVRNGSLQLDLISQKDHYCSYGNPVRDPAVPGRRPLDPSGHCPGSLPFLQRGSAHAPGPVR